MIYRLLEKNGYEATMLQQLLIYQKTLKQPAIKQC